MERAGLSDLNSLEYIVDYSLIYLEEDVDFYLTFLLNLHALT